MIEKGESLIVAMSAVVLLLIAVYLLFKVLFGLPVDMKEAASNNLIRMNPIWVYLGLVSLSFFLSILMIDGIEYIPGASIDRIVFFYLIFLISAAAIGIQFRKVSKRSCLIVISIASFPGACGAEETIRHYINVRYYYPYDRFEYYLVSPAPRSVSNLHFATNFHFREYDDANKSNIVFQFDIDPIDLDAIIQQLSLKEVDSHKMFNPKDLFQNPSYMPTDGDYQIFQGRGKSIFYFTTTIKTNKSHTHAIIRLE